MSQSQDHIKKLLQLLLIERDEDFNQYRELIAGSSVTERQNKGVCWYPLQVKETGFGLGEYPFLVVERMKHRDAPHQFKGGSSIQLFSDAIAGERVYVDATAHYVDGNVMKIILSVDDFPDWIDNGKLGLDLFYDERTFREMRKALDELSNATQNRVSELREILLGDKKKSEIKLEKNYIPAPHINASQEEAINKILCAEDIAIVHGPPGTGKTTTIIEAIKVLSDEHKQILVCAPSNAAVDLIAEKADAIGLNVVRIGNISRVDDKIISLTLDGHLSQRTEMKEIKRMRRQAEEFYKMAGKYKRNFGPEEREQRKLLYNEARDIRNQVKLIESYLIETILERAQVITCTLVGAANPVLGKRKFEVCIIDEAAQALEPATWIPMLKSKKIIMAGDPFQLPPTIKSQRAQREGLSKTLLENLINKWDDAALLKTQYRMNTIIMGFSNQIFYDNKLIAHPNVEYHNLDLPNYNNHAVEFIDTAGCGFEEKINPESRSYNNPEEYYIIYRHITKIIENLGPHNLPSIGIISPYKEQVLFMQKEVKAHVKTDHQKLIDIDTIDAFQGQERDIIYISMVRSNDKGEIGFLSDYRRMNVAMTRARKKLVIIGDSGTLGSQDFYQKFLDYCDKTGSYYSAWEWMDQ